MMQNLKDEIQRNVLAALKEDIGDGDLSALLIDENKSIRAQLITREDAILCGVDWFNACIWQCDSKATINWFVQDGDKIAQNSVLCTISGNARALLSAERSALNFLQSLSAVASKTHYFAQLIAHTNACIVDTRKTLPGLRMAEKYAVQCAGGKNHRFALWDAILIKENHILSAGGIASALQAAQNIAQTHPKCRFVQIEVENLNQLQQAIDAGALMILLDNFSVCDIEKAVQMAPNHVVLEASGNVNENTLLAIAQTGVQRISIGSLTKDIQAVDLSLRFIEN